MLKLPVDTSKLPDLRILNKYNVDLHAYGFCSMCNAFFDYWRDGDTDFMCPYGCGTRLRELTPTELAEALADCEDDGCFQEEYLYAIPLMPKPKTNRTPE